MLFKDTSFNFVHPLNTLTSISFILSGILIFSNFLQSKNANFSIFFNSFGNIISFNFLQFIKAASFIRSKLFGSIIFSKCKLLVNAKFPMVCTL